jgi:KaiC/GvpD/RAD55 family RecA-like ATPase
MEEIGFFEKKIQLALSLAKKRTRPDGTMTLKQLIETKPMSMKYLVDGLIPVGMLTLMFGPPGSLKTTLATYIMINGASGKDILGFKVQKPFRTLYIDCENGTIGMPEKVEKVSKGVEKPDLENAFVNCSRDFDLNKSEDVIWLKETIKELRIDLVIFDSLSKIFSLDERNEQDCKKILRVLKPILESNYCSVLIIHHARKLSPNQYSRDMEDASGSREISATMSSVILTEAGKEAGEYSFRRVKLRYEKQDLNSYIFKVEEKKGAIIFSMISSERKKKAWERAKDRLIYWYGEKGPKEFTTKEAQEYLAEEGFKETAIKYALSSLEKDGLINHTEHGRWKW